MEIHKLLKSKGITYKHIGPGSRYWDYGLVYKTNILPTRYPTYAELLKLLTPNFVFSEEDRYPTIYAIDYDKHEEKDIIKCDLEICHMSINGNYINTPCYFSAWAGPGYGVTNYRLYSDLDELKNECLKEE